MKSPHNSNGVIFLKLYIHDKTKSLLFSFEDIEATNFKLLEIQEDESKQDKHLPKVEIKDRKIKVKVGDIMHSMTPEHYISFIFLETNLGGQFKRLSYSNKPVVDFVLSENEEAIAVYEYCTLHGLWRLEIK